MVELCEEIDFPYTVMSKGVRSGRHPDDIVDNYKPQK